MRQYRSSGSGEGVMGNHDSYSNSRIGGERQSNSLWPLPFGGRLLAYNSTRQWREVDDPAPCLGLASDGITRGRGEATRPA
jgi:hypothetical protein